NGKTTTTQMIATILEQSGKKTALCSTINFWLNNKKWTNKTKFTTESPWQMQKFIKKAKLASTQFVVIETSSHALDQNRVWGLDYDFTVITNVTREHLDYHKTMAQYRRAKLKLFKRFKSAQGFSIVNLDMKTPQDFIIGEKQKNIGFTVNPEKIPPKIKNKVGSVITAKKIELKENSSTFSVGKNSYKLKFPGLFNIENALAAISVGQALKLDPHVMRKALFSIKVVPGRMEKVPNDRGLKIIIDYALTPDSMEKVGRLIKEKAQKTAKKFIWVFGACGQRDQGKRPIMGEIGAKYADIVIITNEDPYFEDPRQIIDQILQGVSKIIPQGAFSSSNKSREKPRKAAKVSPGQSKKLAFRVFDRRKAIEKAVALAQKGDYILITGKGAEENMKIGKKLIEWNDKRVVKEVLGLGE
ncbi:UDP-N-acetylmuramoyl-L-alanyl-D-glutamate--2,6-diaminopimelate ligase, partial [Patescibacteria group bacterium]|nr:UDP-N-acetylmuramoyl-L-alanyl-D-glutamate--2,6-diaminopimelate ligase [Patescibacteria group bacterium]